MKGKHVYKTAVVTLAAASLISACSSGTEPKPGTNGTEGSGKQETLAPVKLTLYFASKTTQTEEELHQSWTVPVQKKYPHISFSFLNNDGPDNTPANLVAANTSIDLIFSSFNVLQGSIKPYGLMGDMNDLVKANNYALDRFETPYLDAIRNVGENGTLPGLPYYDLRMVLYYNKDLFDKFAVPYPKDGMTWADIQDLAKRLTREDGGVKYRGFIAAPGNLIAMGQQSLPYYDAAHKPKLATDGWKSYFETFLPLYQVSGYDATKEILGKARDLFVKEKSAAMFVMYNTDAPKPNENVNWDAVTLPVMKGQPNIGSQPYPTYLLLSSTSKHREDVFRAITQLTSDEVMREAAEQLGRLSPLKNEAIKAAYGKQVEAWQGKNIKAVTAQKSAAPLPYDKYNVNGQSFMTNALTQVILGETDINTALRQAEEKLEKDNVTKGGY